MSVLLEVFICEYGRGHCYICWEANCRFVLGGPTIRKYRAILCTTLSLRHVPSCFLHVHQRLLKRCLSPPTPQCPLQVWLPCYPFREQGELCGACGGIMRCDLRWCTGFGEGKEGVDDMPYKCCLASITKVTFNLVFSTRHSSPALWVL